MYLEDELVGLTQFGRVLFKLLVLFDLVVVGGVEQQLLDVGRLQSVCGHVHQDLTQLSGGELQMGDEDGCRRRRRRRRIHCFFHITKRITAVFILYYETLNPRINPVINNSKLEKHNLS